jgi:hypothetical protein
MLCINLMQSYFIEKKSDTTCRCLIKKQQQQQQRLLGLEHSFASSHHPVHCAAQTDRQYFCGFRKSYMIYNFLNYKNCFHKNRVRESMLFRNQEFMSNEFLKIESCFFSFERESIWNQEIISNDFQK